MASPTTVVSGRRTTRGSSRSSSSLREEANAKFVFLLDKNGQQIASSGELDEVDPTALASLAAGNVAATEGLAQLIGEDEFSTLFHEGDKDSLHISLISNKVILLVSSTSTPRSAWSGCGSSSGSANWQTIVEEMMARTTALDASRRGASAALAEITDEDIDALFG